MKSGNKLIFVSPPFSLVFLPLRREEGSSFISFPFLFLFLFVLFFFFTFYIAPLPEVAPLRPADDAVQRGHQRRLVQRLGLRRLTRGQNGKKRTQASPEARRAGGCLRSLLLTGSFGHVLASWVTRAELQIKFGFDSPSLQITIL